MSAEAGALFAKLYMVSKDAVVSVDSRGQITHFNPAAVSLFRVKEELAINDKLENFISDAQREGFRQILAKFFEKGEKKLDRTAIEVTAVRGDGKPMRCELTLSAFQTADTYVCALFRDVTERRAAAQKLHEAQKMEVLDRVAGEVAHDVNNLLVAIQGYVSMIKLNVAGAERDQCLGEIERLVKQGGNLMKELRAIGRSGGMKAGPVKLIPVDVNECLMNLRQVLMHTLSDRIVIDPALADGLPKISANLNQLEQAIMNVCLNARDAMPGGGVLRLATCEFTPDESFLRTHPGLPAGRLVKMSFRDTGHGMDADVLRRVFEPFYTTKEKQGGTGLGLTIAYKAVKEHGGYISIESEVGGGTAVDMYFTALAADQTGSEVLSEGTVVPGEGMLLLIEDEEPVRTTTAHLLGSIGYKVLPAKDGEEAIRIFSERPGDIDVAIIDMKMPGKNGFETFQALQRIKPGVKAILSTGYAVRGDTDAMFRMGLRAYILKPYTLSELSSKIARVLKEPQPDRLAAGNGTGAADAWTTQLEKDAGGVA